MKKIVFILLLLVVTATGCEALYKFFYNSLDSIIYQAITGYIDPNPDQERFLRQKIESHMQWHRRVELPKYIATLQSFRGRMAAGLNETDLKWAQDEFDRYGADLFNRISDDIAAFLLSLDRSQVDQMDIKIDERIKKIEQESMVSEEKRLQEMERSTVRFMEFMYGTLTAKQKDEISRGVRQVDYIEPERLRMYRERRTEFITFLREKHDRGALKEYIARVILNPERSYPAYYRERADRRDKTIAEGILRFDRKLVTSEQRSYAVKKIDMLIQVLRELSRG